MLGQRLETTLKSQTLPRLDGQDEEGEVLENQFEILSVANSCPDLTVLEIGTQNEVISSIDEVDGVDYASIVSGTGSFRRRYVIHADKKNS